MDPLLYVLLGAVPAAYIAFHWGVARAPRDPHPLRVLLGREEPRWDSGPERERQAALEDALVEAGWRHERWIEDPEHYDEAGRYRWWGM